MENIGYLFAAYSILWAVIFGYIFCLSQRQRQLQRETESLKERTSAKTK